MKKNLVKVLMLSCAGIYLINSFFPMAWLNYLSAIIMLAMVFLCFVKLPKVNKFVVGGLFLAGVILLVINKADINTWVAAIIKNANLVTLFVMSPMISLPFFYDSYQEELKYFAKSNIQSFFGFAALVFMCTHVLGVLISVGGVTIIYELLNPHAKLYRASDQFLLTTVRGYCTSGFWSPAWASMVVVCAVDGIEWVQLIPIGIAFTIICGLVDLGFIYTDQKIHHFSYVKLKPEEGITPNKKKLITMIILAISMILSIVIIDVTLHLELMVIIAIVSILFPLICALIQGFIPKWEEGMKNYYNVSLKKASNQITLFAAAGFLGKALSYSGIGEKLVSIIPSWMINYPPLLALVIMLLMIVPSLVGIHPVVTGTAIVASVSAASLNFTTYEFIWIVLTGWLLAILFSPFSATSLMAGGYAEKPSWDISIKGNGLYGIACLILFSFLIPLLSPLLF